MADKIDKRKTTEQREKMSRIRVKSPVTKTKAQKEQDIKKLEKARKARNKKGKDLSNPEMHQKTVESKQINRVIQGTMLDYLRSALTDVDPKTGRAFYEDYISSFLQNAKNDPTGVCSRMLGASLFSSDTLNKLDAEASKIMAKDQAFTKYRIEQTLYKQQKDVFNDPCKKVIAINSRQIGKSFLSARLALWHALKEPKSQVLYINLKFENAIKQCYDKVVVLMEELGITATKCSRADGEILLSNGSLMMFKGNSNSSECVKFQGYTLSAAIIDECQTQPSLLQLMDVYLGPALKIKDGNLYLFGTPPRNANNAVFKIWNDYSGWSKYNWNMFDAKTVLGDPTEYIENTCKEKGITQDAPFIQREYYGNIGVLDLEAQVYHPTIYTEVSADFKPILYYIGVDQGVIDNDAISVLKVGTENGKIKCYVTEERKFNKKTIAYFAEQLKEIISKLDLPYEIIIDSAATQLGFELQQTYKIPHIAMAYKYDKELAISQLEDLFLTGIIKIKQNGFIFNECQNTMYKRLEDDTITREIDDNIYHPDILDSLLYASRQFIFKYGRVLGVTEDKTPKSAKPLNLQNRR